MEIVSAVFSIISSIVIAVATVIYTKKTSQIYKANSASVEEMKNQVEVMKDQLAESRRQYEETRRLQVKPYLLIRFDEDKPISWMDHKLTLPLYVTEDDSNNAISVAKYIVFENIGTGTLHNTKFKYISNITKPDEQVEKGIVIPPNAKTEAIATFIAKRVYPSDPIDAKTDKCLLHIEFQDLLGNTYFQDLTVSIMMTSSYIMTRELSITPPELVNDNNDTTPSPQH